MTLNDLPEEELILPRRKHSQSKREYKEQNGKTRTVKPKHEEERVHRPIVALNPKQSSYMEIIANKNLIIATGYPGTSKTYIPTVMACDAFHKGEIDKIYLSRAAISESKSLGYFSGDVVEKMSHWLLPVLSTMYDRLGKDVVNIAIKNGDIKFVPLEVIKGMSFGKNTFVIVDEAEDITRKEAKSILTRQGGGKMVLAGDVEQSALASKNDCGLEYIRNMLTKYKFLENSTGWIDFNDFGDIVRSDVCRDWVKAFTKEEQGGK